MKKVRRILVVCTGNICRSPLAEAFLQRELLARGLRDIWVESAGTAGFRHLPATQGTLDLARSLGLDLTAHRSSPLEQEKVREADLILCLEQHHLRSVLGMEQSAGERTCLLTHFLPPPQQDSDIGEPQGGSKASYQMLGDQIVEACRALVGSLPG